MEKPSVLIVGYGIVGRNIHKVFDWAKINEVLPPVQQELKAKGQYYSPETHYDFAFICVQTPMMESGECDIHFVTEAIKKVKADVIILKSTIPPGTTYALRSLTGKKIIFSPEYYGETHHANGVEQNFVILGGNNKDTFKASVLYQHVYTGAIKIYQTDALTAELVKYMENCFLAMKVVFCNEFYRVAERFGINYNVLRELFLLDNRINPSHTFVYPEQPYYDSKCLNKDIPAFIKLAEQAGVSANLMKAVRLINEGYKK